MKAFLPQLEGVGISIGSPGFFSIKDSFIFETTEPSADPTASLHAGAADRTDDHHLRAGAQSCADRLSVM